MSEDNGIITLSKDINMKEFLKSRLKKLAVVFVVMFLAVQVIGYFDKPTPNLIPYSAQPGCHIVNTPEFQEGIHRAHYIPTSEERPDLYLEGASLQSLKEEVKEKK
jgi:hypothetical protein